MGDSNDVPADPGSGPPRRRSFVAHRQPAPPASARL